MQVENYTLMCAKMEEAFGHLKSALMFDYSTYRGGYDHPEVKKIIDEFIREVQNHY